MHLFLQARSFRSLLASITMAGYRDHFYHKNHVGEKSLSGKGREEEELSGCLMGRDLHDVEILLGDQVTFHTETELIAAGSGEDQRGDIDPEVRDLKTVRDDDVRECGAADELFVVEVNQDRCRTGKSLQHRSGRSTSPFVVLEGKAQGLQVGEQADQAFLLGHAVLDDLVADQGTPARWV